MSEQSREAVIAALREGVARTQTQYVTILRSDLLLVLGPAPEPEPVPADSPKQTNEEATP